MKPRAIHQFISGVDVGDAVTNATFFIRDILRNAGIESQIYAEHIPFSLRGEVTRFSRFHTHPDQVLLVHHSMGHERVSWLARLRDHRILIYHNITPPEFFDDSKGGRHLARYARKGLAQLDLMRPWMLGAIGDSEINTEALREHGYAQPRTIPLLRDVDQLVGAHYCSRTFERLAGKFNILFVGRIAENKCQHELLQVVSHLRGMSPRDIRLVLVGGISSTTYSKRVESLVQQMGLKDHLLYMGKVSDAELAGCYRAANLYLSLSEHEGFGVPFVECMAFGVPILAYDAHAVASTLAGSGLLITEKNPVSVAALAAALIESPALRTKLVEAQRQALERYRRARVTAEFFSYLSSLGLDLPEDVTQHIKDEAAFASRLSWEIRTSSRPIESEIASRLSSVLVTEQQGPAEFLRRIDSIRQIPKICGVQHIWQALLRLRGAPPARASNPAARRTGRLLCGTLPESSTSLPSSAVTLISCWTLESLQHLADNWRPFQGNVHGVIVPSRWAKKMLIDQGVNMPLKVVRPGLDSPAPERFADLDPGLGEKDCFRFLHVTDSPLRSGLDVLVGAWSRAFACDDRVCLVVMCDNESFAQVLDITEKTGTDPGRAGARIVVRRENCPSGRMALLRCCQALVTPARQDVSGQLIAEAMQAGLSVVTTAYGAQRELCVPENSWLIDYDFVSTAGTIDIEPRSEDLVRCLREVRASKAQPAQQHSDKNLARSWSDAAREIEALGTTIPTALPQGSRSLRVGWVSTWNIRCGIAQYSGYLSDFLGEAIELEILAARWGIPEIPDQNWVHRCWDRDDFAQSILDNVAKRKYEALVINFHFAFFDLVGFNRLLNLLADRGLIVVVILHATRGGKKSVAEIASGLACASRVLVHSVDDLNNLKQLNLVDNVAYFPQGVLDYSGGAAEHLGCLDLEHRRIIASFGFLLPHKGVPELIEAFALLSGKFSSLHLLLVTAEYPGEASRKLSDYCHRLIADLGLADRVTLLTDFLSEKKALALLEVAEIVVYPYQHTQESSSAAVRFGISSGRPVACTPLPIFKDVEEVVHPLPGVKPADLARGLAGLLNDPVRREAKSTAQKQWIADHRWSHIGLRLGDMLRSLRANS